MSSTPAASYVTAAEPTKPTAFKEPQAFAPYDNDMEHFVYGKWEYELTDAPRDCMVRSLPCVSIAQISARVDAGSYNTMLAKQFSFHLAAVVLIVLEYIVGWHFLDVDNFSALWATVALVAVAMVVLATIWARDLTRLRTTVRERFQIEGSPSDDCWAVWCCLSCAVAQMARQTKSSEYGSCDMEPRDALPAYQA